ncbi:uncharacterized protein LOC129720616 [Wyeomyia smithii]|uniref:uncharacterized protein LOC129720616 n=1 Tax=Wyeomyia smithii TaxID=174621 RepID=UPI00246810FF|nr:uncharacterized protein LOC129720616 [Wyeomyia smithii]
MEKHVMEENKCKYTGNHLNRAVTEVREGKSYREASRGSGVPVTTIRDAVTNRYDSQSKGAPPTFTAEEEDMIVKWVLSMAAAGFPVGEKQLILYVAKLAEKFKKEDAFKDNGPTRGWVKRFMERHPELVKRTANNMAKKSGSLRSSRMRPLTTLKMFWRIVQGFSTWTSQLFLVPRKQKVFAAKESKNVQALSSNSDKENYTVLISASAAGKLAPPLILFPYKSRLPAHIVSSVPKGWPVGRSESGWMNSEAFFEYIANVFYPWALKQKVQFPLILFVDGHSSHTSFETIEFCKKNGIILVSLFPNATHVMQPLDVSFFAPLKNAWQEVVKQWRFENDGAMISRANFAPLLEKAIDSLENKDTTLTNGFRKCGLYPFDADAIDYKSFPKPLEKPSTAPATSSAKIGSEEDLSDANDASIPENRGFLESLNSRLSSEKLYAFRANRNNLVWSGPVEDVSLFYLWRNAVNESEGPPKFMVIDAPFLTIKRNDVCYAEDFGPINAEEASIQDLSNLYQENNNANFLPNETNKYKITEQKLVKRAFPSVATSKQWEDMYMKEQQAKIKKENARKRIEIREKNRISRQEDKDKKTQERKKRKVARQEEQERKMQEREIKRVAHQEEQQRKMEAKKRNRTLKIEKSAKKDKTKKGGGKSTAAPLKLTVSGTEHNGTARKRIESGCINPTEATSNFTAPIEKLPHVTDKRPTSYKQTENFSVRSSGVSSSSVEATSFVPGQQAEPSTTLTQARV